jgi:hypothetical protein
LVQGGQDCEENDDRVGLDEGLVSNRSRRIHIVTGKFPMIDEGNGLEVAVYTKAYCCEREHGHGMGQKSPLHTPLHAIDRV